MVENVCVFCAIVSGNAPASVVHSEEDLIVFCDLNPITRGHLLVVPKAHSVGLADLPEATGQRLFGTGQRMAAALRRSGLPCDGVNLLLADGEAAGQTVFHVHLHVIPRHAGDPLRFHTGQRGASRSDLDAVAGLVSAVL
ncbi:HIT family protein [Kutzneria viridogrisea]|uniref:HIT domain-containing protein n=2 Tax=Kutzneria TaxID=43356 RepID=W5WJL2_9PSEU|nr:HIT family protein [Kutzneria albida]AHI00936.1 hypothetical protein KALB_7578 [Kutzneria albida DSM 43870]MBA8926213.1 diadenosine tetraphosphate (Ap4A) HIT family hydrolase [Kutzneria viridogrisea]